MIEFNVAKQLLQKLPIGYYLKRRLDVSLENCRTSYFDVVNNRLAVSYPQLRKLKDASEEDIRCLLYHEVSHALLTPLKLHVNDIRNIFEDERIETICKDFYLNVNFKEFCKKVNGYNEAMQPNDEREFFYFIVRFRKGPADLVEQVHDIIKKYSILNRLSPYLVDDYETDVDTFYREVCERWKKMHQSQESKDETQMQTNAADSKQQNNNAEKSSEDIEDSAESIAENIDAKSLIVKAIRTIDYEMKQLVDVSLQNALDTILHQRAKKMKMNRAAMNSYSGAFDARSADRQDCKFFIQSNRNGNVRRFSKLKLNLFIDTSGSFYTSEKKINKLLFNLAMLEKKTNDFEFDVIAMNESETLLEKSERCIICNGCNLLDDRIFEIFKKVQSNSSENVNIVLFDGYAFSAKRFFGKFSLKDNIYRQNFKAFNKSNVSIISDKSNEYDIEEFCPAAKKTIVAYDYADNLISNVLRCLQYRLS